MYMLITPHLKLQTLIIVEFHFMIIAQNKTVILSSLTISGFNTVIENNGLLCLRNTILSHNIMDYKSDPDYGGAIKNLGVIIGEK